MSVLVALGLVFLQLSFLAIGGGNAMLPEMRRQVVDVHHWMSAQDFSALFALAQAAPGPNMMIVPMIGWHVAGLAGMLVVSVANFGPTSIIAGVFLLYWEKVKDRPWRKIVQTGLGPVTVGLVASSANLIVDAAVPNLWLGLMAGISAALCFYTRIHPLIVLGAGAIIGLASGLLL
jgi:chromate transporter